jgi:uncharacterized protein DUF4838
VSCRCLIAFCAIMAVLCPAASAAPRTVPVQQLAKWEIIVGEEAVPAERYAAEELQRLLNETTGVEIPINTNPTWGRRRFYVGPSLALLHRGVRIDTTDFGEEELRIRIGSRHVAIAGGRPRGTLYGVYHFAEAYLGVRFLTADHTHVFIKDKLILPRTDLRYAPPFSFRWSFYKELLDSPAFAARVRNNATTHAPRFGGVAAQPLIQHSLHRLLPVAEYGGPHPEYFALVDGQRLLSAPRDGPQVCSSNPAVIKTVTDAVLREIEAHPARRVISVSQNDNDWYCECPQCAAINDREGSPMGAHLHLVNSVAARVAQDHPLVRIGTLAYWYTRRPPKHMRPHPNVQIQLCSIEHCPLHAIDDPACPPNAAFCQDLEAWRTLCDDVWVWHYVANLRNLDLPFADLQALDRTVRYFRDQGVHGLFMQGNGRCPAGEMSDLRSYAVSRLLWNPDLDGMALTDEFLALHYGPAAEPLRAYLELIHEAATRKGVHPTIFSGPREWGLDADTSQPIMALFDQAMARAPDDAIRARVVKASLPAYKALIETAGILSYGDGRIRLTYPPELRPRIAAYPKLCTDLGMDRSSEFAPLQGYLEDLARNLAGAPAVRLENGLWRLTVVPGMNGLVVDMRHKLSARNLLDAYDHPGVNLPHGVLRQEGPLGGGHSAPSSFTWTSSGDSVTMKRSLSDGSLLTRTITLGTESDPGLRFTTCFEYRGDAPTTAQFRVAPELSTGGPVEANALPVRVLDTQWRSFSLAPACDEAPDNPFLSRAVQGIAFHNSTTGQGVRVTYEAGIFEEPHLQWNRGLGQVELELFTEPVVLQKGGTITFHYQVDSADAAPLP